MRASNEMDRLVYIELCCHSGGRSWQQEKGILWIALPDGKGVLLGSLGIKFAPEKSSKQASWIYEDWDLPATIELALSGHFLRFWNCYVKSFNSY